MSDLILTVEDDDDRYDIIHSDSDDDHVSSDSDNDNDGPDLSQLDEDLGGLDSDDDAQSSSKKFKKRSKKSKSAGLNNAFQFEEQVEENKWDFEAIEQQARRKRQSKYRTTLDEKIDFKLKTGSKLVDSDSESDSDSDSDSDSESESESDSDSQSDESEQSEEEVDTNDVEQIIKVEGKDVLKKYERRKSKKELKEERKAKRDAKKKKEAAMDVDKEEVDIGTDAMFEDMGLSRPLLKAVSALGYTHPTPVQEACIPLAIAGRDIAASAATGSGKTAAFILPVLERLVHLPASEQKIATTRALILLPTRELAVQCFDVTKKLAAFTKFRASLVCGGFSFSVQEAATRTNPDIIIATPGRLIDLIRNSVSFGLDTIEILILDEADRLLDMGFTDEVEEIVKECPVERQTMLFSATMSRSVVTLAKMSLNKPKQVKVDALFDVATTLTQEVIRIKGNKEVDREAILMSLCSRRFTKGTIVFFKTKKATHRFKIIFGLAGLKAAELQGNMTQNQRLESLMSFRDGRVDFLLATDVASRGLDISGVQTVINYEMPRTHREYIHRVGRTARAGKAGRAVTFVGDSTTDRKLLKEIVKKAKDKVKSRIVAPKAINRWKNKMERMELDIQDVERLERKEGQLRRAEMELTKAENMLLYADEISRRPAKTWFMSEYEKKQLKTKSKEAVESGKELELDLQIGLEEERRSSSSKETTKSRKRTMELPMPNRSKKRREELDASTNEKGIKAFMKAAKNKGQQKQIQEKAKKLKKKHKKEREMQREKKLLKPVKNSAFGSDVSTIKMGKGKKKGRGKK